MPEPRIGKPVASITWGDGSPFNGYAVFGLVLPTSGGTQWPELSIEPGNVRQRLPLRSTIPVVDGVFNNSLGLWYNADINPPNSKYCVWYYDGTGRIVGQPTNSSDFFIVSTNPFSPVTYTLATPTASGLVPTEITPGGNQNVVYYADNEIPSGTINGSNATFTLTATPTPSVSLTLYRNGVLLKQGADYTLTGSIITFGGGEIPQTGDLLLASYRYL